MTTPLLTWIDEMKSRIAAYEAPQVVKYQRYKAELMLKQHAHSDLTRAVGVIERLAGALEKAHTELGQIAFAQDSDLEQIYRGIRAALKDVNEVRNWTGGRADRHRKNGAGTLTGGDKILADTPCGRSRVKMQVADAPCSAVAGNGHGENLLGSAFPNSVSVAQAGSTPAPSTNTIAPEKEAKDG